MLLANQLAGTLRLANACSPGFIITDLTKNLGIESETQSLEDMGALPVSQSTVSVMHLLFSDAVRESGRYYGSDGRRSPLDAYRSPSDPEYVE